jgi:SulP family sulfate permease
VLFDAESAPLLDLTGTDALESLRAELAAQGITLAVARAKGFFGALLARSGVAGRIGQEHLFPTVQSGIRAFRERRPAMGGREAAEPRKER